jgi:hypothetical protein
VTQNATGPRFLAERQRRMLASTNSLPFVRKRCDMRLRLVLSSLFSARPPRSYLSVSPRR